MSGLLAFFTLFWLAVIGYIAYDAARIKKQHRLDRARWED